MFNQFFGGGGMGGGNMRFQFNTGGGGGGGFPGGFGGMGGGFPGGMGGMGGGGPRHHHGGGGGGGGFYEGDSNVVQLSDADFPTSTNDWVWLVEYYSPGCGHWWVQQQKMRPGALRRSRALVPAAGSRLLVHVVQGGSTGGLAWV
jgi:hypothetical protein